jgi:2-polyprenyl-3-methyl-5-hydroxy-6-metoxy-1,4-benzoquinol methylase
MPTEASVSKPGGGEVDAQSGARCPACTRDTHGAPVEQFDRYSLYECTACAVQFWHPVEMRDAEWHESLYSERDARVLPLEPGHNFFLRDARAPRPGRLLDVGCGTGNFLAAAQRQGYDVTGIELNRHAVRTAREQLGLPKVFAYRLEEFLALQPEPFDVVTFFEVLEHQDRPAEFLRCVRSLLKSRGWIALSVPNRERWQTAPDVLDYPPNHLTRWNAHSLRQFMSANGFEVLETREEPLRVARAAQMLSMAMRTGFVGKLLGNDRKDFRAVAQLSAEARAAAAAAQPAPWRRRAASMLTHTKAAALQPAALVLLPFLRARGCKGLYLYCSARRTD